MGTAITFEATFIASVLPEYANYGVDGYTIGTTHFRSFDSLEAALTKAFEKDLGAYRELEVQITVHSGTSMSRAVCTSDTYSDVITALRDTVGETKLTLDDLLEE